MCFFELWFSQDVCPGVGLQGHMVVLFFSLLGISIVAVSIYIPTNSARGLFFSTPFTAFIVCGFLMMASLWWEVISYCSFDLHFSNNQWCWASFHVPLGHLYLWKKCLFRSSAHFLIELFSLPACPSQRLCKHWEKGNISDFLFYHSYVSVLSSPCTRLSLSFSGQAGVGRNGRGHERSNFALK